MLRMVDVIHTDLKKKKKAKNIQCVNLNMYIYQIFNETRNHITLKIKSINSSYIYIKSGCFE